MAKQTTTIELTALTGPPGPVLKPADCPGFGQELPTSWICPICPIARDCYEALLRNQQARNGKQDK